jgi:type IV pilus assembly protein PilM
MFPFQTQTLGIEVRKNSLRLALLKKTGSKWSLVAFKEVEGSSFSIGQYKEAITVSAIPTRDILMRPCEIQLKKKKHIKAALSFHVEPLLPYPLEKAIIQSQILETKDTTTQLNVFAARKDHIGQWLERLHREHNLDPQILTTRLHALAALATLLPQTHAPLLLAHEGEDELSLVILEKGALIAARSVDLKKDAALEIQKSFFSFAASLKTKEIEFIYFFGSDPKIKEALQAASNKPVSIPNTSLLPISQEEFCQFGLSIGTALAHQEVNFREQEFVYPFPFKRLKKSLAIFFTLSIVLSASIYTFGKLALSRKQQAIESAYMNLLKIENIADTSPHPLLSPLDYNLSLQKIEKEIKERPDTFPLHPQVPKVKEVMSWLAAISSQGGKENFPIQIDSLHYQMVKRPDFQHKKDTYRVKVELEFTTKDQAVARSFQEALKNSHSLADPKEEISWIASRGKYKTSFYLKDKTKYGS